MSNEKAMEEAVDALSAIETLGDLLSSAHEGHQGFEGINEIHMAGLGTAIALLARRTSRITGESPLAPGTTNNKAPPGAFFIVSRNSNRGCFGTGANPRLLPPSNSPYTLTLLKMISVRVPPPLKAKAVSVYRTNSNVTHNGHVTLN